MFWFSFQKLAFSSGFGKKIIDDYGSVWCIDHRIAKALFKFSAGNEIRKRFGSVNVKPTYVRKKQLEKK